MRMRSGILFTTAMIFASTQAFGDPRGEAPVGQAAQGIKGQPGPQGSQNPIGQTGQAPVGQASQGIKGQPGQQAGQNPIGQPGQAVQNSIGQSGNPIGQPGMSIGGQFAPGQPGQSRQNPIGQPGMNMNGQPALGQNGQPVQNSIGQPTMYFNGQPVMIPNGQPEQNTIGQPGVPVNGQPALAPNGQPLQNTIGQPGVTVNGQPALAPNGQPLQNSIGQPGMSVNGQPALAPNGLPQQNSIGQPGVTVNGQPALAPNGQAVQNTIGEPDVTVNGQPVVGQNGQPLQNANGQAGISVNGQPVLGQNGQLPQNPASRADMSLNGQLGRTAPGQSMMSGQNQINQPAIFLGAQNHFGVPLYQNSDVRRSLNLTDAQIRQLSTNNPQFMQQLQNQLGRLGSLTEAQRSAELQNLQTSGQQEFWRSATNVFTPEQTQRYRQLEYQYQGPGAFSNPEVRSRLNLTNDQAQRLQELHEQNTHWMQMFQAPGGSGQDAAARYSDYRQQLNEKTNAILTPDQRRGWQEMTGDPYDFRVPVAPPDGTASFWKP